MQRTGLNAEMITQPANSPDTIVLDLVFWAVQSTNDEVSEREEQMIEHVKKTFAEYPRHKINQTWLTLMPCLNCIIENLGRNNYKISHLFA